MNPDFDPKYDSPEDLTESIIDKLYESFGDEAKIDEYLQGIMDGIDRYFSTDV